MSKNFQVRFNKTKNTTHQVVYDSFEEQEYYDMYEMIEHLNTLDIEKQKSEREVVKLNEVIQTMRKQTSVWLDESDVNRRENGELKRMIKKVIGSIMIDNDDLSKVIALGMYTDEKTTDEMKMITKGQILGE